MFNFSLWLFGGSIYFCFKLNRVAVNPNISTELEVVIMFILLTWGCASYLYLLQWRLQ